MAKGGEDSADSSSTLLTVSDGVGGWTLRGIDPGLFSKKLTRHLVDLSEADSTIEPRQLMKEACEFAKAAHEGSATVVTLKLVEDMKIQTANLGDSGYALFHVRADDTLEMYYRSLSQ